MPDSMQQQANPNRIAYLDMLRIFATLGVILLHIFAIGYYKDFREYNWYVDVIGNTLCRWCVPVFVMISGTLFLNPQRRFPIKRLYKKYIFRLFLAFVFWGLFYSLFTAYQQYQLGEPFLFKWKPYIHLWFLPMLMAVYALLPVLRKIASDNKLLKYTLALWCVYLTGSFVLRKNIELITPLFIMNTVVGYSGYFLLGYYLSQASLQAKHRKIIYWLGILSAIISIAGNIGMSLIKGRPDAIFLNSLYPNAVLMSVAVFVLFRQLFPTLKPKAYRFIEFVRNDLFGIYLVHLFWLHLVDWSPIKHLCNTAISLPLFGIAIFVISLCTVKLIRLVPFLRRVVE